MAMKMGPDPNRITFRVPRGRYVLITVSGYQGFVKVDNTESVDRPVLSFVLGWIATSMSFIFTQETKEEYMPKYRNIHTRIADSFDFNEMPDDFSRLLWVMLFVVLDSEGRGYDTPKWIQAKAFPSARRCHPASDRECAAVVCRAKNDHPLPGGRAGISVHSNLAKIPAWALKKKRPVLYRLMLLHQRNLLQKNLLPRKSEVTPELLRRRSGVSRE